MIPEITDICFGSPSTVYLGKGYVRINNVWYYKAPYGKLIVSHSNRTEDKVEELKKNPDFEEFITFLIEVKTL